MKLADVTKEAKKLMTAVRSEGEEAVNNAEKYIGMLGTAFGNYAMLKNTLNIYTLLEMAEEYRMDDGSVKSDEFIEGINCLKEIMNRSVFAGKAVAEQDVAELEALRDRITARMRILTAYTDAFEMYEYVLNRMEAAVKGWETERVNPEELSEAMFEYSFQNSKDTALVNARIKDFVSQLPIRMTKLRFFDIISSALNLYKNGEKESLRDFISAIKTSVLMELPEGFEEVYPELFESYTTLAEAEYKSLSEDEFDALMDLLGDATRSIEEKDTRFLMLQEVVNDSLNILLVDPFMNTEYLGKDYEIAKKIASGIMKAEEFYSATEEFDPLFIELEGKQEEAYEKLSVLDSNLDELTQISREWSDKHPETAGKIAVLRKADKLTSTSLFVDLDKEIVIVTDQADAAFVEEEKKKLLDDFSVLLKGMPVQVKRAVMAKVLSMMPVFFNSQDEIKEYFLYALETCGDQSELAACSSIIMKMMQD